MMWQGQTAAGVLPLPYAFFAPFIFFNLFFQIQPSSELDSVDMNFMGEADAVPSPHPFSFDPDPLRCGREVESDS